MTFSLRSNASPNSARTPGPETQRLSHCPAQAPDLVVHTHTVHAKPLSYTSPRTGGSHIHTHTRTHTHTQSAGTNVAGSQALGRETRFSHPGPPRALLYRAGRLPGGRPRPPTRRAEARCPGAREARPSSLTEVVPRRARLQRPLQLSGQRLQPPLRRARAALPARGQLERRQSERGRPGGLRGASRRGAGTGQEQVRVGASRAAGAEAGHAGAGAAHRRRPGARARVRAARARAAVALVVAETDAAGAGAAAAAAAVGASQAGPWAARRLRAELWGRRAPRASLPAAQSVHPGLGAAAALPPAAQRLGRLVCRPGPRPPPTPARRVAARLQLPQGQASGVGPDPGG